MTRPVTRQELRNALPRVILVTLALMAGSFLLLIGVLLLTDFKDAWLHYAIATVFTLILAPAAAFPLIVVSDRIAAVKEELEGLLRIDALTELPNRRAFFEEASRSFLRNGAATLMMVDVDHFKHVNDTYGHDTGDAVLRAVAQTLQNEVTKMEVGGVKFAARIGGEEFAILVEGLEPECGEKLAGDLVAAIASAPVQRCGVSIPLTVSIGVAHRRGEDSAGVVLRAADHACYRAKRLGRNQWCAGDGLATRLAPDGSEVPAVRTYQRTA